MEKLYISDLDGTLLDSNAKITDYTRDTLNELIFGGLDFTFATARTCATVLKMLEGINLSLPAVLMNGALVYDMKNEKYIKINSISPNAVRFISECAKKHGISGFCYTIENNVMHTYYDELKTDAMRKFHDERVAKFNKRFERLNSLSEAADRNTVYFSYLNSEEVLNPFFEDLKKCYEINISYYRDIYYGDLWYLEISSRNASKRSAVEFIKEYLGVKKVICFGDNLNDIPMFEASDEKYAVKNANEKLKELADKIIMSNDENGVAEFLRGVVCSEYQI